MARARQAARERGAQRKGPHLEAYLYSDRLARMMGPTQAWPSVAQRDLLPIIVDLVAGSRDDVVLRALAIQNTAAREPVPFDIRMFWNQHAFSKGEEIASTVINPRQTRGEILEDLAAWLRTKVREVSINRRVIPGPRNEVGEVGYDLLLEVVDKVQRLTVPAKVGAVAARDVRSADPLAIDFYVVPAETPVASRSTSVADERR
jgi:hypothetical protein